MKSSILIIALLFLAACAQNTEKIKIGVSEPFTGPPAFIGERIKNGIELAFKELPMEDQSQIELIYEDDGCTGKQALTAMQKLTSVDKIDYLLGPTCNTAAVPTIDILKESGTIYISTGVIGEKFASAGEHHFTLQPRVKDLMYKLADYAYDVKGARTMSIFHLNEEFGQESALHFGNRFTERGGRIVAKEDFAQTDNDFRTQISKLKEQPVDGILAVSYGSWLINQLKQMNELGLKTQLYGPVPIEDPALIKGTDELAEGIIYSYPDENPKTLKQLEFDKNYKENYNAEGEIYARMGYDSFAVLWDAVKKCNNEKACVQKELSRLKNHDGAGGLLSVDQEGIGKRNILIKMIKNGKFVYAEESK